MRFLCLLMLASVLVGTCPSTSAADAVSQLSMDLKSADDAQRLLAIEKLGQLGPVAAPAAPTLAKLLGKSDDLIEQLEIVTALNRIGAEAAPAVPALVQLLGNDSDILKYTAAQALKSIGPKARPAAAKLKAMLKNENQLIAVGAAAALVSIAKDDSAVVESVIPVLLDGLRSEDEAVASDAVGALARIGAPAATQVSDLLGKEGPVLCRHVCDTLAAMGPAADTEVDSLLVALDDKDASVCRHAVRALGVIGAKPDAVVPALAAQLKADSADRRSIAAQAIGEFGTAAEPAVSALAERLVKDDDIKVRIAAAEALGAIGPAAAGAVESLAAGLNDPSGAVTLASGEALGKIGEPGINVLAKQLQVDAYRPFVAAILQSAGESAAPAVPELIKHINDPDETTQGEVIVALAAVGPKAATAIAPLEKLLRSDSATGRPAAAYALGKLKSESSIPLLKKSVSDPNEKVRNASAFALVTMNPSDKDLIAIALPRLIKGLKHERPLVRVESARAIRQIGLPAQPAIPALLETANDSASEVRAAALAALSDLQPAAAEAIPVAVRALEADDETVRFAGTLLLARLGADAKSAVAMLRDRVSQTRGFERIITQWAIVKIDPSADDIKAAIPLLISALDQPSANAQIEAVKTLSDIGRGNGDVRKALRNHKQRDDVTPEVKTAITAALKKLAE